MEKATIYDYARMCITENKYCRECPLSELNTNKNVYCAEYLLKYPDKANEIILKWCEEHPIKTRQSEFLKMFPNAQISSDGVIEIMPCAIEKNKHITSNSSCTVAHGFNNCDECRKKFWLAEVKNNE